VSEHADSGRLGELRAWVENVATYFTQHYGIPPIRGRVMGWLMICEPAEQSAADIAEAIQASRASLSGALQVLTASGLVQASTRPGVGRTTYYRITDDAWAAILRQRFAGLASFLTITEQGLRLFPADSPARGRVLAAHGLFSWLQREIEPLWERWDAEQSRAATAGNRHGPEPHDTLRSP
jgi:DNA-binding MarR family transcriptional regulator